MKRIENNQNFLKILSLADKKLQNSIIKHSNKEQIYCLCEIVLNLLKGNIKISKQDYDNLKKYKKHLRKFVVKKSLSKKKYILQKGGFLEVLIPTVLSTLVSVVSEFIK